MYLYTLVVCLLKTLQNYTDKILGAIAKKR